MPKRANRDERRRHIVEALWRITVKGGLSWASFGGVAGGAGVSVRLIQYYFGTKDQLLLSALQMLAVDVADRFLARVARLGPEPAPRDYVRTVLDEFIPSTAARRN